ncbi:autotransporter [Opitutaceae bacterium TAV4]|nr:autotransporter [Opitutaceae bacterium TAV4]RRK00114.1 autotransporter [Opitutaceae bacterium TAV3]
MKSPNSSLPVSTTPASGFPHIIKITTTALIGIICLALQPTAQAATKEWIAPSSVNLGGANNWTGASTPTSADEVLFATVPNPILTTGNNLNWGDLVWNTNTSGTLAIASGQSSNRVLSIGSGTSGSTAAIAAGGAAGDLIVLGDNVTNGTLTISGENNGSYHLRLSIGRDGNINVKNANATLVISADSYQGDFALTKTGLGTLTIGTSWGSFGASKTFTIAAGTVNANHGGALGAGNVALEGGVLTIKEGSTGTLSVKAGKTFTMSAGTLSFTFANATSHDQITTDAGTSSTFNITGGILDLNNSIADYSVTYTLFKDFDSGSITNLQIINYDTANYTASLGNNGVLSFVANTIPEPSTWTAIIGSLVLTLALLHRRRH